MIEKELEIINKYLYADETYIDIGYNDYEMFKSAIECLIFYFKKQEKEIYNIKQLTTFLDACIMTDEILDEFKLKEINDYNFILAGKQYFDKGYFKENYIHKDKIKEKIEKLEKEKNKYKGEKGLQFSRTGLLNSQIYVLKELLESEE